MLSISLHLKIIKRQKIFYILTADRKLICDYFDIYRYNLIYLIKRLPLSLISTYYF